MFAKPTAVINLDHLKHNARLARSHAPDSKLLAVVKANAYGHGVHQVVKALRDEGLADGFAVARFEEALELRQTQKDIPVLVLGGVYTNNELDSCLQHNINVVVHQQDQVDLLCNHVTQRNTQINIWLKMDSGMHRLGIFPEQFLSTYQKLRPLSFIKKLGALTHFANAEQEANEHTQKQLDVFQATIKTLPHDWPVNISLANSAAVLRWPNSHGDWNRPGLMLYGINPLADKPLDLKPVMSLRAPIVSIRTVNTGEYVGYSMRWHAKRPSIIATVALGYGDGYPTQIKADTPVLIDGQRAPIVGRVSMDLITVDCTDLAVAKTGDDVTFWGEDECGNCLPVEEIAQCAGTIPYDLVSKIGGRVKYTYV